MGERKKKKAYRNKNLCVYFIHLPRSPPCRNLHKILHDGSPPRCNQPCQILSQSGQGFWFCGGSNFWIPHKKEKSPLTQGLNYRSACDKVDTLVSILRIDVLGIPVSYIWRIILWVTGGSAFSRLNTSSSTEGTFWAIYFWHFYHCRVCNPQHCFDRASWLRPPATGFCLDTC